ncbi:Lrp/AsnC family transcriptional regulator [Acidovorax sp. FJL06]|uniref:Lrp/AsnC family transcriptional regulator n=1 Tax=Acidovorax sp. FJL06 TaxID=2153365 RepID=UPI003519EB68
MDRPLLALLQQDAETPPAELADAVNLSNTPCWRRSRMWVRALRWKPSSSPPRCR